MICDQIYVLSGYHQRGIIQQLIEIDTDQLPNIGQSLGNPVEDEERGLWESEGSRTPRKAHRISCSELIGAQRDLINNQGACMGVTLCGSVTVCYTRGWSSCGTSSNRKKGCLQIFL